MYVRKRSTAVDGEVIFVGTHALVGGRVGVEDGWERCC